VAEQTRAHAAEALDRALLQPLSRLLGDRDVVVVPTMALHALPWPALPALAGRPVSVAPSAAHWLDAVLRPKRRAGATVLVAGPDLVFAEPELTEVARFYPGATRLQGRAATAERVRQAIDAAGVVHVACHGHFRSDNPQFSSLALADGPLMVYDLERLHRAPELIVLSSCDAGLSAVHPGDEMMGLSSALFALGTRTLVAPVNVVDDEAAKTLMVDFHARLAAGRTPAHALAGAQQAQGVIGFACFGAG
jgi:CHAT domain-containing protein